MKYALAVDIGASSGRHILGWIEDGKIQTEEIYRFENNFVKENGSLVWDIDALFKNVIEGIKKCKEIGKIPSTIAIDTWGVDYVLLDENENELKPAYCYRDARTEKIVGEVENIISQERLYEKTGIQKQQFNTIYQLYADKISGKLDKAKFLLMMPAYLSYKLTGKIKNEYTNCSTMGLLNAKEYAVDKDICKALGINPDIFGEILMPGDIIGDFKDKMQEEIGFNAKVMFCPSHDTASAVCACPLQDNDIYISSGTWSLIGTELKDAVLTEKARICNFTNEGGIEHRFRFLKNYMGMWLFQNIRRNLDRKLTYEETIREAESSGKYHYIDVNAPEFLAPDNMIDAIKDYLKMPDLSLGELLNSVYHSLAKSYKEAISEVEKISGINAETIHIVGGGCQDKYLNRLTAEYTGKKVTAGPIEATAIGNLISQLYNPLNGYTLEKLREIVINSFDIEEVM